MQGSHDAEVSWPGGWTMTDIGAAGPGKVSARRLRGLALSQVIAILPAIGLIIWMWIDWWGPSRDVALACLEARGDDPRWIVANDVMIVVVLVIVGLVLSLVGFVSTLVLSPWLIRAKAPRQSLVRGALIGFAILAVQVVVLVGGTLWLDDQSPISAEEGAEIGGCGHLVED